MKKLTKALAIVGVAALATSSLAFAACSNEIDYENAPYQIYEFGYKAMQAEKVTAKFTAESTGDYKESYEWNYETGKAERVSGYTETGKATMEYSYIADKNGLIGDATSSSTSTDEDGTEKYDVYGYFRNDTMYTVMESEDADGAYTVQAMVAQTDIEENLRDAKKEFKEGLLSVFGMVADYVEDGCQFMLDGEETKEMSDLEEGETYTNYSNLTIKCTAKKLTVSGTETVLHKGYAYDEENDFYYTDYYRDYYETSEFTFECNIKASLKADDFATDVIPASVANEIRYYKADDVTALGADFIAGRAITLATLGSGAINYKLYEEQEEPTEALALTGIAITYEYDGNERTFNMYSYQLAELELVEMADGSIKIAANTYAKMMETLEESLKNSYGDDYSKSLLTVTKVGFTVSYQRTLINVVNEEDITNRYSASSIITFEV